MEFKRCTTGEGPLYEQAMALYADSFPLHEQRQSASQRAILGDAAYHFDLICEGDLWVGLLLYWETPELLYVEHFCIRPQLRGQKYGQRALALLSEPGKPVVLEIDPPVDELSRRRAAFYQRAGYCVNPFPHVHPPYRSAFQGHPLQVLSCPAPLTPVQYRRFAQYLETVVMAGEGGKE